jgi:hypothetical protein
MTACVRWGVVRIFRWGPALLAVAALALGAASPSHAQTAPKAPGPKTGAGATPAAKAAPSKGGNREGIAVHGHWTIEVRNPDGKVVNHREFENMLSPGLGSGAGGASLLAAILGRVVTPGGWAVLLTDATSAGQIDINEPGTASVIACVGVAVSCSSSLSVTGPQFGPLGIAGNSLTGTTFTLTGSGVVPTGFPSPIAYVQTSSFACAPSASPSTCATFSASAPLGSVLYATFTARLLDGNTPAGAAAGDPNPVPVIVGQTVAVTVVISFQ